jgi:2-oxoglutarate dehydrogenase complex dehydrogenase (E1) component-like enzyme
LLGGEGANRGIWKLRDILEKLRAVYTEYAGFEYTHITNIDEKSWIRHRLEMERPIQYNAE